MSDKTKAGLLALITALNAEHRQNLENTLALMDDMCSVDAIPSDVRQRFNEMKAAVSQQLKGMIDAGQVVDAMQAGTEVASTFSWLERRMADMGSIIKSANESIRALSEKVKAYGPGGAELAKNVDAELARRVQSGLFVEKATFDAAVNAARNQGGEEVRALVKLHADRKARLAKEGLPVVELALNAAKPEEFDSLVTQGKNRLDTLKQAGVQELNPDSLARLAYCSDTDFEASLAMLRDALSRKPDPARSADPLAIPAKGTAAAANLRGVV